MNWQLFFITALLVSGLIGCKRESSQLPNVVIILTDDQGWGDIASHGNPEISTPNLDQLAADGVRFQRFFVSPVCAPTRASLLTGRDHLRTGTQWVTYGLENMRAEEQTFAEVFKDAGYQTGLFGKWHNGSHYPMDPKGQGFDTFFGFKSGHWNNYFNTELEYNGVTVQTEGYITDVLTDSALAFINKNRNQPFLAFIPYNAPHSPFQLPDEYFDKYKKQGLNNKNASVYGMVENIDDNVGRVINRLDELNLTENTIVIFLTDNGPNGGDRYNGLMKGWKAKVDEGGVRVPLFIKWPAKIPAGSIVEELTAHIDFLPGLTELAGINFSPKNPLDGRSFAPLIFEENQPWPDRYLFTHQSRWDSLENFPASIRNNQYRAVRYGNNWELYDLMADSTQSQDLASFQPEIVELMSRAYDKWFVEVTRDLKGRLPIPAGYPDAPINLFTAVESYFSEGLHFYGTSGWSNDWVTGWSTNQQRQWWEIEVAESGEFIMSIEYSLPKSENNLSIYGKSNHEIKEVSLPFHEAAQLPSPDRVERTEVYERHWGWHDIGIFKLNTGVQKLEIGINPKQAMESGFEVKSLKLVRIN